jgi:hypothetical protein
VSEYYVHDRLRDVFRVGRFWSFKGRKITTKDTKSTKVSENVSFDAVFQFGYVEVHQQTRLELNPFVFDGLRMLQLK